MTEATEAQLQEIYDDLGRPGVAAFKFGVKRAGYTITDKEAKAFVGKQSVGQVFQGRGELKSDGKIPGGRQDMRWQCDLIDFSKKIEKLKTQRYVLICVDLADRVIYTAAQKSKTAEETLRAFKEVIADNAGVMPKEVTVDLGKEYALLGPYIQERAGTLRKKNVQAVNTLGVVDAAIMRLKRILSGRNLAQFKTSLEAATNKANNSSHTYLMGSAPEDYKSSETLQYVLEAESGKDMLHNNQKWKAKVARLSDKGGFRTARDRSEWERIDQPTWSGDVKKVDGFKGANVEDTQGKSHPVKTVLPVPAGSKDIKIDDTKVGPGAGKRATQKAMLQDFAQNLYAKIPDPGLSIAKTAQILNSMRGFKNAAEAFDLPVAARFVKFTKLFPKLFQLAGEAGRLRIFRAPREPAPPRPPPRPAQVGGASSSNTDGPARTRVELEPRAPYKRWQDDWITEYSDENPSKRQAGPKRERYEKYKRAKTIGEARRLGATSQDFAKDEASGALSIFYWDR